MPQSVSIRSACAADAAALAAIYAPYVTETAISFEEAPPSTQGMAERIAATQTRYPYLVAEDETGILGYAYASAYRPRHAYRFTAEVSAYCAPRTQGCGVGCALYEPLLERLTAGGFRTAVAIITLPNDRSVRFHERMGFNHVGTIAKVGHKFEKWHDTGLWQRDLSRVVARA